MKALNLIFANFIFVMILSCKDEKPPTPTPIPADTIPAYTDTGANVFACKVNGRVVFIKNLPSDTTPPPIKFVYLTNDSNSAYIKCFGELIKENYYESISFTLINVTDTGKYKLGVNFNLDNGTYLIGVNENDNSAYTTGEVDTGEVHILKYDKVNRIISGKFIYNARYFFGDEIIKITDGQFDLKY